MPATFDTLDAALMVLSNPEDPAWADAFNFLARQPETARLMIDTFRETLQQMGVEPSGIDPSTGEPSYSLADIARAMGVPPEQLEASMDQVAGATTGAAD